MSCPDHQSRSFLAQAYGCCCCVAVLQYVAVRVGTVQGKWEMFAVLFGFGLAQSAALVPTLEAMKLAAPSTGPLAAEGAVRLFNMFQDAGQVVAPVAGGVLMRSFGFDLAAETLGAVSVLYALVMLVYLASVRPIRRDQSAAHFTFTGYDRID